MKIPLDAEIWKRLYGPYGNRQVNLMVAQLQQGWDGELAKDLYWEELHHQNTLYPATFAALPWLVEFAPTDPADVEEINFFLSQFLHCAFDYSLQFDAENQPQFQGLATQSESHAHSWLTEAERLIETDMPILEGLRRWFSDHAVSIADRCVASITGDDMHSAYLLCGSASVHRSPRISDVCNMLVSEIPTDEMIAEVGKFTAMDVQVLGKLKSALSDRAPKVIAALEAYPCEVV